MDALRAHPVYPAARFAPILSILSLNVQIQGLLSKQIVSIGL